MGRRLAVAALAASLVAVGGCSDFRSRFSAHSGVVAEAGGQRLTADRLSRIMTSVPGAAPSREAAEYVTQLWVDHVLFAQAAVTGTIPKDSASIAEASWSEIAEIRGRRWHDTLVARRGGVDPAKADSAYRTNDVRVFQHILFRSMLGGPATDKAAARKKAETTLRQLRGGADFSRVASEASDDIGSRVDSGFLPASRRGQFVPAFDSAGWALGPGETSGIVETQFGYHIIKRPTMEAARSRLVTHLTTSESARLDSVYMENLAVGNKIEVSEAAPAAMKAALEDPNGSRRSTKAIATFKSGKLTVGDFVRWLQVLPPHYGAQLKQAPDSMLQRFARILSQNTLLLRAADSAGVGLTPEEWTRFVAQYVTRVDTLRRELGLATPELTDSSKSTGERKKLALRQIDEYFDSLATGRRRLYPIPPGFASLLRDRGSYRIHEAGLTRAFDLARAARAAESAAAGGTARTPAPTGPMQRAPGPPPIPVTPPADASAPADSGHSGAH